MKKIFVSALVFFWAVLFLPSCASRKVLAKPEETSLEFWIAEDVSAFDFSGYCPIFGVFGGSQYFGKGYASSYVSVGYPADEPLPERYVIYLVTAYPDYADGGRFVTGIEITDPSVSVYGVTCLSSFEEFDEAFRELKCEIEDCGTFHRAVFGRSRVDLSPGKLSVAVTVTNRSGIMF